MNTAKQKNSTKRYINKGHRGNPEALIPYHWKKGQSGNPKGRQKGQTLKDFAREFLSMLDPEDKRKWLASMPPEIVWRMAEGNPTEDKNISITVPRPILGGVALPKPETQALESAQKALNGTVGEEVVGTE